MYKNMFYSIRAVNLVFLSSDYTLEFISEKCTAITKLQAYSGQFN